MPDLRTECKEQVKNFELRPKKTLTVKAIRVFDCFSYKIKSIQRKVTKTDAIKPSF
jgi:hypothetical protein